jgi:hypothetical protein
VLAPFAGAFAGCDRPDWEVDESATAAGTSSTGGTPAGTAGSTGGSTPVDQCAFDRVKAIKPIFAPQTINTKLPARKELYALVTDAEAEALRKGGSLIPPVDDAQPPDAVKMLDKVRPTSTAMRQPLIDALKPRFASVRAVWPNPWALRLVEHAGSEHMNIVRIVLRDTAWFARITDGSITTSSLMQSDVTISDALAEPERIAALFYEINQRVTLNPSVDSCEDGRRVMVLGDESMIEEWSLGTEEVLARLDTDIDLLDQFFKVARLCSSFDRGTSFRSFTVCQTWPTYNVYSEYTAYQWTLSTPTELYKPSPQNLAALIEALQGDRFEPDPYVFEPEPPVPAGGAGNAGGAGGAGDEGGGGGAGGAGGAGQGGAD